VLQGVDDGEVALQRHRHRHVHGPSPEERVDKNYISAENFSDTNIFTLKFWADFRPKTIYVPNYMNLTDYHG
jgi:hypothetical protein